MGAGSGDAALLYLYILSCGGRFDASDAAAHICRSETQVMAAMDVLARLGLVEPRGGEVSKKPAPADELPEYRAEDIKNELDNGSTFKSLVGEVQKTLGKLLSSEDLKKLFGIYDYLGLPPEVILQLVTHCAEECRRRSGPGRVPTMRYIEKAAYSWEREGIFSLEAAEAYLKRLDDHRAAENDLAEALGISGRTLSATEKRYLDEWSDMGFDRDAVALAYDRTVVKTGRLTWRYMDSIIRSWHGKGLHTLPEIESGDTPRYKKEELRPTPAKGGVTAEDLNEINAMLEKLKGGN